MLAINLLMVMSFMIITNNGVLHHEEAHEAIANHHGCQEGKITQDKIKMSGQFMCLEYMERPNHIKEQEIMLHSMNEIKAYNQVVTNQIIFFSTFIIVNVLLIINIYKNDIYIKN